MMMPVTVMDMRRLQTSQSAAQLVRRMKLQPTHQSIIFITYAERQHEIHDRQWGIQIESLKLYKTIQKYMNAHEQR